MEVLEKQIATLEIAALQLLGFDQNDEVLLKCSLFNHLWQMFKEQLINNK